MSPYLIPFWLLMLGYQSNEYNYILQQLIAYLDQFVRIVSSLNELFNKEWLLLQLLHFGVFISLHIMFNGLFNGNLCLLIVFELIYFQLSTVVIEISQFTECLCFRVELKNEFSYFWVFTPITALEEVGSQYINISLSSIRSKCHYFLHIT